MFEIGWTEILFIGLVAVLVLKPKDYPEMMRSIGQFLAKARTMAADFQGQFNEAMKDANLQDVKKTIDEIRDLKNMGPIQQVKDTFVQMADEAAKVRDEVKGVTSGSGMTGTDQASAAPSTALDPAPGSAPASASEPLPGLPPVPDVPAAPPVDLVPKPAEAPATPAVSRPASDAGPTKAA